MGEHRGLWAALGIALVTIGAGGAVSLLVGEALTGRTSIHLGHAAAICNAIWAFGAVIVIAVLASIFRQMKIGKKIARFTLGYVALLAKSHEFDPKDEEKAAALLAEAYAYRKEVVEYLQPRDNQALIHFVNDAGKPLNQMIEGTYSMGLIRTEIDLRLQRLGELYRRS